ncbi:sodium/proline symporter [Aliiglaciecola sp. 2_MG-2023]|uniref:sodium/proline symporter n=1 Tax=unclassified Aliiglaciecola TaxID=2593648 RepID=UPI0026E196A3|nr:MULTISPECIES: sodium/proline symporter [unclassified Aliiglaciecola]MDO6710320.1 sodium/proline symporter [Aliiglaciecola sp. 2_MG-2023]MDO6751468.1 sodium/proline symporter [Aliiglaciecola sp. 1_MG-2023]
MSNQSYILVVLVVYKLVLLGIGFWAQRRVKNSDDFFLGGRGLGPFVAAVSYSASSSSAWKLLGFSGVVMVLGISGIWLALGSILGMFISWYWFAPRLYRTSLEQKDLTVTDFLSFGSNGQIKKLIVVTASIIILVSFTLYVAAQFQGAGNMFSATFDMPMTESVLIGALIIFIYTVLGGFWAVSMTDALQGSIMAIATLALPIAAVVALGGPIDFVTTLIEVATPEQLSLTGGNVALLAAGVIIGNLSVSVSSMGQPHMLLRFMALRDEKSIKTGRRIAAAWFLIVDLGVVIVGLAGLALQMQLDNPENLFFVLTTELFHPIVAGVITAAVLSAIMSTADSQLLVSASVVAHDLGLEKRSRFSSLTISRLSILLVVVFSVLVTLYMPEAIFSRAIFAWVALGASFGPIIIVRLCNRDINPKATLLAMITGFVFAVTFYMLPSTPGDFLERVVPFSIAIIIAFVGSKPRTRIA